ncbi:methenyltetrahydrofolate cyclohydrolase [candidate division LCP-89 bacterium B3_LCP]|uniref:Methenyltetrahydrofolate cyclohydrolase n=1 Tax=candidate division LCP-89 bacterium B3_LCP TaxID=2012998 RepID=A0A532V3G7_UNCL8|nr:MAG: methenyltetrahydrofolate cyclohydrolase [candidate division LCP-89 bacterium B3_LCP]
MLLEKKVNEFIAETASKAPAPGGGSASALAGAVGTALTEMVVNLTVGKKKYADVSAELSELLPKLSSLRSELESAVDRDTEAFNGVMDAFGMPKETDEEKTTRNAAIQEATIQATVVPLQVMEATIKAMELTQIVAEKGNKNSISDAGVAALLLGTALDGASLNVMINLPGIPEDHPFRGEAAQSLKNLANVKKDLVAKILNTVALNL